MNTLVIFSIVFVLLDTCFAQRQPYRPDKKEDIPDRKQEREDLINFYECLVCKDEAVIAEYNKCQDQYPEKYKVKLEKCLVDHMPKANLHGNRRFEYFCRNKYLIEKVYDCLEHDFSTMTKEDKDSMKKFNECSENIKMKYCRY